MKLQNKAKNAFQASYYNDKMQLVIIEIQAGEVKDITDEKIAKQWLSTGKVVEFSDPVEAKAKEKELLAEIEKLKAENAELKGNEKEEEEKPLSLDELKKIADELDISYPSNIGIKKLQEKIDAKKAENEE